MSARLNARVGAASALLILATASLEPWVGEPVATLAARSDVAASIERDAVTLRLAKSLGELRLDLAALRLRVNAGPPIAPVELSDAHADSRVVRLRFTEGAGAGDAATLDAGAFGVLDVAVETPAWALPTRRIHAPAVQSGDVALVLGGASAVDPFGVDYGKWLALDSIVAVDLVTGRATTSAARLPEPLYAAAAVWDARASSACPSGCAFLFGGSGADGAPRSSILRFDPATGEVATLDARLPAPASSLAVAWTGEVAYLFGAGSPLILRFDPATEAVEVAAASPLTAADGMGATFDPRSSSACPSGCAYLFGGHVPSATLLGQPGLDPDRDSVIRFEPVSGAAEALTARLPVATSGVAVAWTGSSAVIVGGSPCDPRGCRVTVDAIRFDPLGPAVRVLPEPVPLPTMGAAAAWRDGELLLVSGVGGGGSAPLRPLADVVRFAVADA